MFYFFSFLEFYYNIYAVCRPKHRNDAIGFRFVIITVKSFNSLGPFLFLVDCDSFAYFWGFYFVNASVFNFNKKLNLP